MNPVQILSILSALAATVWSVWTWSEDQKTQRQVKRDQEAVLYVNPYLIAAEELQSLLYNTLEGDELALYKREYPDQYELGSPAAIEFLYRLSQFFGWTHRVYRYSPYAKDPRVIELLRKVAETFESRTKFPGDAFRFSIDERTSLGQAVVRRVPGSAAVLPVLLEAVPLFQFEKEIKDEKSEHAALYQSRAVRLTLAAIDRADKPEALEGHERLAVLQNLLIDSLAYLEKAEGFSVSLQDRRKARLTGVDAQVATGPAGSARILHQTRGRIRLGVPRVKKDKVYASALQSLLESVENVESVRVSAGSASVIVGYSPDIPEAEFASKVMRTVEAGSIQPGLLELQP
jgi:hypothetical protein